MLETGIKNKIEINILEEHSAREFKSGNLNVLATPFLTALMEETAWKSVENYLEKNNTTVGTFIEIKHLAPTPIGMKVSCTSELVEINGRELVFKIEAFDEIEKISECIHKRFIVNAEIFQQKANKKM